jgi:hypothetical protein
MLLDRGSGQGSAGRRRPTCQRNQRPTDPPLSRCPALAPSPAAPTGESLTSPAAITRTTLPGPQAAPSRPPFQARTEVHPDTCRPPAPTRLASGLARRPPVRAPARSSQPPSPLLSPRPPSGERAPRPTVRPGRRSCGLRSLSATPAIPPAILWPPPTRSAKSQPRRSPAPRPPGVSLPPHSPASVVHRTASGMALAFGTRRAPSAPALFLTAAIVPRRDPLAAQPRLARQLHPMARPRHLDW